MRTGVTLDDITRAADALLGRGERPTVEGVRAVLGTGSPATVNTLLKDYFRALQGRLNLPAPVAQAAANLVATIRSTLDAEATERESARAEFHARAQADLATERAGFETERQQLRNQMATLTIELTTQRDRAERADALLQVRQGEMATLAAQFTAAETRAQAAIDERERVSQSHHSEIARLKERADGNERHLLAQLEELRAQLKQARADREREAQQTAKRQAELEQAANTAGDTAAGLRKDLAARDAELAHERQTLHGLQAALQSAQDKHEREMRYQQERLSQVALDRDQANAKVVQLVADRDRLAQSAAVLEGRCSALESELSRNASSSRHAASGAG